MLIHLVVDARIGADVVLALYGVLLLELRSFRVQFHHQLTQVGPTVLGNLINSIEGWL